MKWISDHHSESQLKQKFYKINSPKKSFPGLQQDLNLWPLRSCCSALPAELRKPIHWRQANLLSSSTRERNETQNEMMWIAGIQMKWMCDHHSGGSIASLVDHSPGCCKEVCNLVTKAGIVSMLHDCHQLYTVVSKILYPWNNIISKLLVTGYFGLWWGYAYMAFINSQTGGFLGFTVLPLVGLWWVPMDPFIQDVIIWAYSVTNPRRNPVN